MAGQVLDADGFLQKDNLACLISKQQYEWNMLRQPWLGEIQDIRNYIYATDTRKTANSALPWKNTTTIPKLCQIRDNLQANYMASNFPKRKFVEWEGADRESNTLDKKRAITSYMCYAIEHPDFKQEMTKCIQDYIDTGNAFAMPVWLDGRVEGPQKTQMGYVGASLQRINPIDIVFNPIAPSFERTPKIIRSIVSLGEVKKMLQSLSNNENREEYEALYQYLKNIRRTVQGYGGELNIKDNYFNVDGFTSYQHYLQSNYCEVLRFYGDLYDPETDEFLENQIITVVDRHKIIDKRSNPSWFGTAPIYHVGWRRRQDNLWAMGPLANLVGLQYRVDHLENIKADVLDLIAFPVLKIKGYVDNFEWKPLARINLGDADGDVEMVAPPFQVLQLDQEILYLMNLMEEMAGAPKEAMGFRTPGEKTKYEFQQLQNAANRIFSSKSGQFDEFFVEPVLNGMLEVSKRNVTTDILVKYFDDEFLIQKFLELTPSDITGQGRIKPYAARHFTEQAERVQNLTQLFASPLGQYVAPHYSSIKLARMLEDDFDLHNWKLVLPYVAIAEQAESQRIAQAATEQVLMEALTPSGLTPEDSNQPMMSQQMMPQQPIRSGSAAIGMANGLPMDQGVGNPAGSY